MDMSRSRWLLLHKLVSITRYVLATLALIFFQPQPALAFDFTDAEVTEKKGVYHIKISAEIKAPSGYVRYVLADYAHIYRLSASIIESEVLPDNIDGEKQVRTRLLLCTSVFCTEAERVDVVRMLASGDLEAEIVPELSEFKSGKATWKITPVDDHSFLVYEAVLEPDFFIPPVIGTRLVIENLRKEFARTFIRIEKIARVNARRDHRTDILLSAASPKILRPPCKQNARASLR
jgi:hypothetical protein